MYLALQLLLTKIHTHTHAHTQIHQIGNLAIAVNHRRLAFRQGRDLLKQHMKFWDTEKYVSLLSHIKCNLYLYICMVCGMLYCLVCSSAVMEKRCFLIYRGYLAQSLSAEPQWLCRALVQQARVVCLTPTQEFNIFSPSLSVCLSVYPPLV